LLHCYGERLFHLAQSKKELTVAESNLDEIEHSSAFYRFMQERILENTLHHGHPVFEERLCAYLLATKGAPDESWLTRRFVEEIEKTRESVTPDQTARALASLVRASIFSFGKEGYSLVFPLYREILVNTFPNTRSLREG
jgi:hypothetical protein